MTPQPRSAPHPLLYGLAALLLFALTVEASYCASRSRWAMHDDSGLMLLQVSDVLERPEAFNDSASYYGPVFYLYRGAAQATSLFPLTHDGARSLTLCIFLAFMTSAALLLMKVTKEPSLTFIAAALLLLNLLALFWEPGHPQELVEPLVILTMISAAASVTRGAGWSYALTGAGVALVLLTKVNLGVYLLAGLGLTVLLMVPRHWRAWAVTGGAVMTLLLGLLILGPRLSEPWWLLVFSGYLMSTLPILAVCWREGIGASLTWRQVAAFAAGLAGMMALILTLTWWAFGAPPTDILYAVFVRPYTEFLKGQGIPREVTPARVIGLGVSALLFATSPLWGRVPALRRGLAALVAASSIVILCRFPWLALSNVSTLSWLWILVLQREGKGGDAQLTTWALLAGCHALVVFPVSVTQLLLASAAMALPAAAAARGAMTLLASPYLQRRAQEAAILGLLAYAVVTLQPLGIYQEQVSELVSPALPGATEMRLAPSVAAELQWVVANVNGREAPYVVSHDLPSLELWCEPPRLAPELRGYWLVLVSEERQLALARDALKSPSLTVVLRRDILSFDDLRAGSGPPLLRELSPELELVGQRGPFTILGRRGEPSDEWLLARTIDFQSGSPAIPVHHDILPSTSQATLSLWLRTREAGVLVGAQAGALHSTTRDAIALIELGEDGRLRVGLPSLTGARLMSPAIADGEWHHIAWTQGREQQLHLDGQLVSSLPAMGRLPRLVTQLGDGYSALEGALKRAPFRGELRGVKVTRPPLSPEDIARAAQRRP